VTGKLEYPTLRQTDKVVLCDVDRDMIREMEAEIRKIVESDTCPPLVRKGVCRNCSYFDFCFAEELEVTDSLDKKGEND
ncbi:MAG TPA: Dna2/Cas4 domain-containing protein, partial [Paludibacteraceae bacterium]|nr:Dna2/Cas4 domain-containing protein [Paludibacteraceae bacterium]